MHRRCCCCNLLLLDLTCLPYLTRPTLRTRSVHTNNTNTVLSIRWLVFFFSHTPTSTSPSPAFANISAFSHHTLICKSNNQPSHPIPFCSSRSAGFLRRHARFTTHSWVSPVRLHQPSFWDPEAGKKETSLATSRLFLAIDLRGDQCT